MKCVERLGILAVTLTLLAAPLPSGADVRGDEPLPGAVATPAPIAGNPVSYWRDSYNTVVGVSRNGQLVFLELHGYPIINKTSIISGYALEREEEGSGVCTVAYDAYAASDGEFQRLSYAANIRGGSTYPGRLITTRLVVASVMRTADGQVRLRNVWTWKPRTFTFKLTQTYENLSPVWFDVFRPKVVLDVDVADPMDRTPDNYFMRTNFSVSAWTDEGFLVTLSSPNEPRTADVFWPAGTFHTACGASGLLSLDTTPPHVWSGDGALGIASWNFGPGTYRYTLQVQD